MISYIPESFSRGSYRSIGGGCRSVPVQATPIQQGEYQAKASPSSSQFGLLFRSRMHPLQDVLVLGTSALQPGSIVDVRPLGFMCMGE